MATRSSNKEQNPTRPKPNRSHMTEASSELFDVICDVLRTDLKLGSVELTMETPLVGDELGLDSLDLLMVVTGTEKRLGIKIPNEKLGRDTMGTVGAFVDFVAGIRGAD